MLPPSQVLACTAIIGLALALQLRFQPYRDPGVSQLETLSLLTTLLTLYLA
jgi:hypothetical protein